MTEVLPPCGRQDDRHIYVIPSELSPFAKDGSSTGKLECLDGSSFAAEAAFAKGESDEGPQSSA